MRTMHPDGNQQYIYRGIIITEYAGDEEAPHGWLRTPYKRRTVVGPYLEKGHVKASLNLLGREGKHGLYTHTHIIQRSSPSWETYRPPTWLMDAASEDV